VTLLEDNSGVFTQEEMNEMIEEIKKFVENDIIIEEIEIE